MAGKAGKHYKNIRTLNERIKEIWGDRYTILEDPERHIGVRDHIHIRCNKCGNEYNKSVNTLVQGYQCKYCAGRYFSNTTEMKKYIHDSTNGEYDLISDNYKIRDIGLFRHNSPNCRSEDHLFNMKIHNFTVLKQRCPYCNNQSKGIINSKGIQKIKDYLEKNNIPYESEYKFNECRSPITNQLLSYDIYLPKYNLLIEYDGQQHFQPIDYFGGEDAYKKTILYDNCKNEYAKAKNIKLLRISYLDFFKIDNILDETFNDHRKDNQIKVNNRVE